MRERRRYDIEPKVDRTANVVDGHAVSHGEHPLLLKGSEGVGHRFSIGTGAVRGINGHDVGAGRHAGARMPKRRRDVDAVMAVLPQSDDRHLDTPFYRRDIGKSLATNGSSPTKLARARHEGHSLRRAERLARICLNAHDQRSLK